MNFRFQQNRFRVEILYLNAVLLQFFAHQVVYVMSACAKFFFRMDKSYFHMFNFNCSGPTPNVADSPTWKLRSQVHSNLSFSMSLRMMMSSSDDSANSR